ncbi:hypothetical protein B0H14DRAFT_99193 [Mycena olivaceomarginata]|nr:hypothetical protein B0H14DRAFT_99193 [Mycena olivaceomarginata]
MPAMHSRSRSVTPACSLIVFNEMEMEMDTGSPVCRTYPFPAVVCTTFTLPAVLLSHSLLTRHLLSAAAAAASRSSPTRKRCPADPAPPRKLKFSRTTARAIQLRRAPSTHASHARRSPSRSDPTSPSGQPRTHPARCLRLTSTDSACSLRLTPDSGLAPATHLYPHEDSSSAVRRSRTRDVCSGSSHPLSSNSFPPFLPSLSGSFTPSSLSSIGPLLPRTTPPFPAV